MGEVAVFIDLENIVTSLWKNFQITPDPLEWMRIVSERYHQPISFARAYGDFSQGTHSRIEQRLRIAGIEPFNCPVKVRDSGNQSTVDMNLAIDLLEIAIDRPAIDTFVLMAGDSDYMRAVATLRYRWCKKVIIMGVAGSTSRDLVTAAGASDLLSPEILDLDEEQKQTVIRIIHRYVTTRNEGVHPTFRFMGDYLRHQSNQDIIPPEYVEGYLRRLISEEILRQETIEISEGRQLRTTMLNTDNEAVRRALDLDLGGVHLEDSTLLQSGGAPDEIASIVEQGGGEVDSMC